MWQGFTMSSGNGIDRSEWLPVWWTRMDMIQMINIGKYLSDPHWFTDEVHVAAEISSCNRYLEHVFDMLGSTLCDVSNVWQKSTDGRKPKRWNIGKSKRCVKMLVVTSYRAHKSHSPFIQNIQKAGIYCMNEAYQVSEDWLGHSELKLV